MTWVEIMLPVFHLYGRETTTTVGSRVTTVQAEPGAESTGILTRASCLATTGFERLEVSQRVVNPLDEIDLIESLRVFYRRV